MVSKGRESIACDAPPAAFIAPLRVHLLAPLQSEVQERVESRYLNGRRPVGARNYVGSFRSYMGQALVGRRQSHFGAIDAVGPDRPWR